MAQVDDWPRGLPELLHGLSKRQSDDLTAVHEICDQLVDLRLQLHRAVNNAIAYGCTLEQVAEVMGIDRDRARHIFVHKPGEWTGIHPTDPEAPETRAYWRKVYRRR